MKSKSRSTKSELLKYYERLFDTKAEPLKEEIRSCFCTGPKPGEKLCPCMLRNA